MDSTTKLSITLRKYEEKYMVEFIMVTTWIVER